MRLLVTGANGFIGTALCQHLVLGDFSVHGLVRAEGPSIGGVTYYLGSLDDQTVLRECLAGVDCVIHLAGRAHVMREEKGNPLTAFRVVNRDATLELARIAQEAGVKRFVFISSIGVNGAETSARPFDEFSYPKPHAAYAISKLEAEEGLRELVSGSDMELVIIRPPLVYAGGAPGNFQRLLKLLASGIPLPFASVDNRRSMLALENLVSFICLCIEHPAAANELFLISDGVDVSTPEIITNLAKGMGRRAYLWPLPDSLMCWGASLLGRQALYSQLCGSLALDSSKARNLLGWRPMISPVEALQQAGREYISLHAVRS